MSSPRNSGRRRTENSSEGWGPAAVVLLVVLALVATIIMVVTSSDLWTRVALVAALWAAVIGAFLVARYRRAVATAESRAEDMKTVYELQLEREIAARREHELTVENQLRAELRDAEDDQLMSLRRELVTMRAQLSQLLGEGFSLDEQAAIGTGSADDDAEAESRGRDAAGRGTQADIGGFDSESLRAVQWGASTAETTRLRPIAEDASADTTEEQSHHGAGAAMATFGAPQSQDRDPASFDTGSLAALNFGDSEADDATALQPAFEDDAEDAYFNYGDGRDAPIAYDRSYGQGYGRAYEQSYARGYDQAYGQADGQAYSEGYDEPFGEPYEQAGNRGFSQGYAELNEENYDGSYGEDYSRGDEPELEDADEVYVDEVPSASRPSWMTEDNSEFLNAEIDYAATRSGGRRAAPEPTSGEEDENNGQHRRGGLSVQDLIARMNEGSR